MRLAAAAMAAVVAGCVGTPPPLFPRPPMPSPDLQPGAHELVPRGVSAGFRVRASELATALAVPRLRGHLRDIAGNSIAGATVTVAPLAMGGGSAQNLDDHGDFMFELPPGAYELSLYYLDDAATLDVVLRADGEDVIDVVIDPSPASRRRGEE